MKRSVWRRGGSAVLLAALLLSCPNPISKEMVNRAEDILSPRITLTAPEENSVYYSSVEVSGTVTDDALELEDGEGVIQAIAYEVLYDPDRRGGLVRSAGSYTADPNAGTGAISFGAESGEFSFPFSTVEPSVLSGQITLRITVTDSNGNTSVKDVKMIESTGPVIELEEPGTAILDFTDGTQVYIRGGVRNSVKSSSCDEIVTLEWNASNVFRGSLDLTGGDPGTAESDGVYTSVTEPQGYTFTFDTNEGPNEGCFESCFSTDDPGTDFYRLVITARDVNGHQTVEDVVIYRESAGPGFEFTAATNTLANTTYLTVQDFQPFPVELSFSDYSEVTSIYYKITSPDGDSVLSEVRIDAASHPGHPAGTDGITFTPNGDGNGDGDFTDSGECEYAAIAGGWAHTTRSMVLYVTAKNAMGEPAIRTKQLLLDSADPAVSIDGIGPSANPYGGIYYTRTADNKTISYNASDDYSGIAAVAYALGGVPFTPGSSGEGWFTHDITGAADGASFSYSVTATDEAGNSATATQVLTAYTADPLLSVDSVTVDSGSSEYVIPGDTVTVDFSSNHVIDMSGAYPAVTFAGFDAAHVSHTGTALTCRIAGFPDQGSANAAVDIDVLSLIDAAGRSADYSDLPYAPALTYDPVEPVMSTANIATFPITGTLLRSGDRIDVGWDALTDGNTDIDSVTIDFSGFGGGDAVPALDPEPDGTWITSYTISGSGIDADGIFASVTARDFAGNVTTAADDVLFSVDTDPPTINAANIAVSGGSGANGEFTDGDLLTAAWDASADGNGDITGAYMDLSAFGGGSSAAASESGGVWRASCTVNLGAGDHTARVSVSAADDAGYSTGPVDDNDTYTVDNALPTIAGGSRDGSDTSITVTFSEGVYAAANGTGALGASDFVITFTDDNDGDGGATGAQIDNVSHFAGDSAAALTVSYTGGDKDSRNGDTVEIQPASSNDIFDAVGLAVPASATTGGITLSGP